MKRLIICLLVLFCSLGAHAQWTATMAGTTIVTTGWSYPSIAGTHDSVMRLTSPSGSQTSYAVYNTAINMAGYCQFTADFDFQIIRSGGGTVADGITFFFLSNPPPSGLGGGYLGLVPNSNGLILALDTYDNNGDGNNPLATILGYNGSIYQYNEGTTAGLLGSVLPSQTFISDGNWHHVTVTYYMGNINVYFNYSTTPGLTGYYPLAFSGYFGFSATTGGAVSTQNIKMVNIVVDGCLNPVNNGPLCQADSVKLQAIGDSTGASYYWYGPNGFTSTLQNPVFPNVTYADSGVYYVVKTVAGISGTSFTVLHVKLNPTVTAASNTPVCYGATINLTSSPYTTGETFGWTGPGTFSSTLQNPSITGVTWVDTGFYTVIATLNGCKDTSTTHVDIIRVPIPSASNTSPTCLGYAVTLNASDTDATATYTWSGPSGYSSALQNPTMATTTAASAGVYTVTAHIGSCTSTNTTTVVLSPTPPVPSIGVTPPICSGQTLNLTATDTAGATYSWVGPNGFSSTLQNPTITGIITAATGSYTLVCSYGGCASAPAYVYVLVDSTPATPTITATTPLCSGDSMVLTSACATPGVRYNWTGPASYTSTMQNNILHSVITSQSGNYTVTVTKGACSNAASVTVVINQTPTAPVTGSTSPMCSGGLLTLSAYATPSTGTYHWTGPNSFTSLTQNPSIGSVTMYAAGIYTVYEEVNGCISPISYDTVVINPTPAIPVVWSNSPVCEGDTLELHAIDDTAGVSYNWTGPSSFTSTDQNPTITNVLPAATGVYTVSAILGPCAATNITSVNITNAPPLIATNNGPVCTGDTLKLIGTSDPGNTFVWIGPYSFTAPGSITTRYPAISEYAGVYTVTVTEPGGCFSVGTDTVIVHVTPAPPWVPWLKYCQYAYAPPLMAVEATNVLWFPSGSGGTGSTTAPTPNTNIPGIYFFYLNQTMYGCVSEIDSIQVIVNPKPVTTLNTTLSAICPHDTIRYIATNPDPFVTYHWYPSLYLDDSLNASVLATPITDIGYQVVATNEFGCSDTQSTNVTVYAGGVIMMQVEDSVNLYPGESYHIQPMTNCINFSWFPPAGLNDAHSSDPIATPEISTIYYVEGVTERGCKVTDSIYFHLNQETLYGIPNAFTPGNGVNNTFKIAKHGISQLNYFRIYDRWGVLMFETNNINDGWDGTFKGAPQPLGVYVYVVQAVSSLTNKVLDVKGNVTLLR